MGWGYWGGFAPYVSKAEKQRRAAKAVAALEKKGIRLEPVRIAGREISRTWWGQAWARNLERYSDFSNRLPRGRTYVRSGSVLDLKIAPNLVTALVSGSRPQPYKVSIKIKSLDKNTHDLLRKKSRASLDSMQALLGGEFPADLKDAFFAQGSGLFPAPKEISLDCSCPDWAEMCKHVAAALYGVAARLDEKPELFFTLRGIAVADFVGAMVKSESKKLLSKAGRKSDRAIASGDGELSALFGIDLDAQKPARRGARPAARTKRKAGKPARGKTVGRKKTGGMVRKGRGRKAR